jgi:twinkle protein
VEPDVMMNAFGESRNLDPEQLKSPSDFRDPVWEAYYPSGGEEPGYPLPFGEFKPLPFRFRPSEVTVWQGYTKHGKTVCLHFCLAWLAWRYGVKSLTASLEIPAARTIQNMGRQILGKEKPADDVEYDKLLAWMDRYFWIYDHVGTVDIESMLDVFAYTAKKYGVEHFVVDSLMRLDLDEEDNDQQKRLLNRLCAFAKEFDVHIHLVAHSKKPDAKHPEEKCWPSKYSVRGSAHIVDLAHNTLCVWRNKEKEKQKHIALETPPSPSREEDLRTLEEMNDALILVQAQRGGNGDEPIRQLWFDQQRSWQYRGEPDGEVLNMLKLKTKTLHNLNAEINS